MEQIVDLIANIAIPAVAGWFIVLSNASGFLIPASAYKIIMVAGFIFLFFSGAVVLSLKIKKISIQGMIIKKPSRSWKMMRFFNVIYNTQTGLNFIISSVLILVLIGNEGVLGTLQAAAAGLSAIILYIIGRKILIKNSWKMVGFGSLIFFIGAGILAGTFTWIGVLIYEIIITVAWAFQWSSSYSVAMDLTDHEENNPEAQYAYICDNELYYNIGRGTGIVIIVLIIFLATEKIALQWAPFIVALIQLPLAWFLHILTKNIHQKTSLISLSPEKFS